MKKLILLTVIFVLTTGFMQMAAAAGMGMGMGMGPPNPPCGQGPFPPCPIPLDGGITLLGAAGAYLASRKLFKKN